MTLGLDVAATDGAARAGRVTTPRGSFATPCFMPVGTRGTVKTVSSADLGELGAEVMLANAYHLMLRPGVDVVASQGGIHGFASWPGHVLTDSGGYQVFSLAPKVDDDGVTFRSVYDGSVHRLTPEAAVAVQEAIGADIQMVLDVCPALPAPPDVLRLAVDRTAAWAARARQAHRREGQALFGIVQGGVDVRLRAESAQRTVEIGFDGYGVGGLSVGEERDEMLPALHAALSELPVDRVRYLMGVGDPIGVVEAVAAGVDMFDCVLPTRLARHGTALTSAGRLRLGNASFARDGGPSTPPARARCAGGGRGPISGTCSRWVSPPRLACSRCTIWLGWSTSCGGHAPRWRRDAWLRCGPRWRPCGAPERLHSRARNSRAGHPGMAQPLFFALLLGAMYMLLIRPQQARARRQRELITSLSVGDDVITAGGMVGQIVALNDDRVTIRLAPGVDVTFLRGAIAQKVTPTVDDPPVNDDPVVLDDPEGDVE